MLEALVLLHRQIPCVLRRRFGVYRIESARTMSLAVKELSADSDLLADDVTESGPDHVLGLDHNSGNY